jgi:long-chain acyl-CoA synthetase
MKPTRLFDLLDILKRDYNKADILSAKRDGTWVSYSVDEYDAEARHFAKGLLALGFQKGDKIATVSNNRPEWNFVDMGMAMTGVVHVPIYPTIADDEYRYILDNSEAKMIIVGDQQLFNRLSVIAQALETPIPVYSFSSPDGTNSWRNISELGIEKKAQLKQTLIERKASVAPTDMASIIYTSGTTGFPKGVMLSHQNFMENLNGVYELFPLGPTDRALSFLPLCHVFERIANYLFQSRGCSIYYAENLGTIPQNLIEIKATVFATVPRVIERIYDKIVSKGDDLNGLKRAIFFWAMRLGEDYPVTGKQSFFYNFKLKLARKLVFSKWKPALGGELRFVISGGAALQPRLSRLFFAAGIPLLEGYGLTETSPVIAVNHIGDEGNFMIGTVGPALKNVEVCIDSDGEILTKGPCVMMGYYRDKESTEAVFDSEGWFHTGDIGCLINGKYLKITDRKKEMFKLSSGKYIAPQVIENMLKESIFIEQAMVVGDNEKFASALLSPNFDHLHFWALEHKIHFRDNKELVQHPKVLSQYQKEVAKINKRTGKHEELNRFRIVCEPWASATGELSPTLKLKRKVLYKKYAHILRDIYAYAATEENRGSIKFNS